jgi:2-succinyl-5-enolpyruvyl-6-hydroxy-3-cyclohexene-1-carboxylate synthase
VSGASVSGAVQTLWAEVVVGALADAGVELVVVSPGSRSTPLAIALARCDRLAVEVVIDERAAAFVALGRARATGRPAALVCTSGTAGAHYLPAIIEASLADLPLIALTADRPPELQGAGAPQTIDQLKLFGGFVRGFADLGPPGGGALGLRAVRRAVIQAAQLALGPRPGPVHLNVPLRKPLEPAAPDTDDERALAAVAAELGRQPLIAPPPRMIAHADAIAAITDAIAHAQRGLILAGPAPIGRARAAAFALARATGFPILAEATSQLRFGRPADVAACDAFDLVLAARGADPALAPDLIVQLGGEPTAAAWAPWLARQPAARWVIAAHAWPDPHATAAGVVIGDVDDALARIVHRLPSARIGDLAWPGRWRDADRDAQRAITAALAAHAEPAAIRAAIAAAPPTAQLVLGNSLPIRLVDAVCPDSGHHRAVLAQRGANGIDGLIAGAAGAATHAPTLLVLGDVSFAHDAGALAVARAAHAPLAIVVIDNGGGRIFDQLPLAEAELPPGQFARLWRTPPAADPIGLALAHGCRAIRADAPAAIAAAVAAALERPGATIIHAPVDPTSAAAFRRAVIAALAIRQPPAPGVE